MKHLAQHTLLLAALTLAGGLISCTATKPVPNPPTKYEKFLQGDTKYPATGAYYEDAELIKKATPSSPIYICLSQQRGRLYVDNQVAADWPVSTGVSSRRTPTGSFKIIFKRPDHVSATYGKIYNAEGKCIVRDADSRRDAVPEGGKFVGSAMPYWMRMTKDGVGMHSGKVIPGKRLSHGCIRMPYTVAKKLYGITAIGTPVTVSDQLEQRYPATRVLQEKEQARIAQEAQAREQAKTQSTSAGTPSQRQPELKAKLKDS